MIIVTVDGHDIEFPDGMTEQEIAAFLIGQRDAGQIARDQALLDAVSNSGVKEELKLVLEGVRVISQQLSKETEDRFPELVAELNSIKESIPELHDSRIPDLLAAIESLRDAVTITVNAPEVNVSAPIVPAPIVNVDAPDMTGLTQAVNDIQRPDFSKVEEILRSVKMAVDMNRPEKQPLITGFQITQRGQDGKADIITLLYEGAE